MEGRIRLFIFIFLNNLNEASKTSDLVPQAQKIFGSSTKKGNLNAYSGLFFEIYANH